MRIKIICWVMLIFFSISSSGLASLPPVPVTNPISEVETYNAEDFHKFLNTRGKAQNDKLLLFDQKHKKSANVLKVYTEYTNEDVSAASIETALSSAIQDKAAELGNDPQTIFEWVKFNIKNEFHYGSMKDAEKVLIDGAGSPWEQVKLLSALLGVFDIASKYKEGNISMSIEDLMNWTGGETSAAAISILKDNGTPTSVKYRSGAPVKVTFEHCWISALLGRKWVPMDPSIKTYEKIEGIFDYTVSEEEATSIISSMVDDSSGVNGTFSVNFNGIDGVLNDITTDIETDYGHLTMDQIFGKRIIVVEEWSKTNGYVSKKVKGYKKSIEHTEIPEHLKFKVKIQFLDYNGNPYGPYHIASLSEIASKKVVIKHIPATDNDKAIIDAAGNIYDVFPAYSVRMKPELQIDEVSIFTGNSKKLGSTSQWVRTSIYDPAVGYWSNHDKPIESGSSYSMVASQQKASPEEIKDLCEQMEIDIESVDPDIDKLNSDGLHITGKLFHLLVDKFMAQVTKSLNIINTEHVSIAYTCDEIEPVNYVYGYGYEKVNRGGVHLDVIRSNNYPVSATGNAKDEFTWMMRSGTIGSSMENSALEIAYNEEGKGAVSTSRIFHETAVQGGAVHVLGDRTVTTLEEDIATLMAMDTNDTVRTHIYDNITYPYADYDVLVPTEETETLGHWKGQGWKIINRATGESSMMIYGNLQEPEVALNEGISDNALNGAMLVYPKYDEDLVMLLKLAKTAWAAADSWIVGYSILIAGGAKMVAATKVMEAAKATAPIIAATPFVLVGQALGMAFVAAAAITFVYLVANYVMAFILPRREYYYV